MNDIQRAAAFAEGAAKAAAQAKRAEESRVRVREAARTYADFVAMTDKYPQSLGRALRPDMGQTPEVFDLAAYNAKCRADDAVYEDTPIFTAQFLRGFALGLGVAIAVVLSISMASAAELRDGRVTGGELRNLSAGFGPRVSDWTKPPAPGEANASGHKGRDAGVFEDQGRGGISGQVKVGKDGVARINIQDLNDVDGAGTLSVKTRGQWQKIRVEPGKNGNWRTLSWRAAQGFRDFKMIWRKDGAERSGKGKPQDGYGVSCK